MSVRGHQAMSPPQHRPQSQQDVVMGPPPVPSQPSSSAGSVQGKPDYKEYYYKYQDLKKSHIELEQKCKTLHDELRRSGERNMQINNERGLLLDRILELESELETLSRPSNGGSPAHSDSSRRSLQPPSTAYPRHAISGRAHTAMVANLRQAMDEIRTEDASPDSLLVSRHTAAQPRKRQADDMKERVDEEIRDVKKAKTTKPRTVAPSPTPSNGPKGVEGGAPAALPSSSDHSAGLSSSSQPDTTLVSSSGKRIRIKSLSTSQPQDGPSPGPPSASSRTSDVQGQHQQPSAQSAYSSGIPGYPQSPPQHHRPPTEPVSPIYDGERYSPLDHHGDSPSKFRNGSGGYGHGPTQGHGSGHPMTSPGLTPSNTSHYGTGVTPGGNGISPSGAVAVSPHPGVVLSPASASASRPPDGVRHAKPKRLKAHTVTSKSFNVPSIPRDKKGRPLLPLNVGIMTVMSLGEVCMREHFHTERYIFPVGYEVTRRYLSAIDAHSETVYHCTILDGGDGPKFQIVAADQPTKPIAAGTATGAWSVVVRAANHIRNRQHSNSVSGPDFFGLGQNTIKHLIQELPNADRLRDYVWQHFWEGGPLGGRHAAVIPALPEDYEGANEDRPDSKDGEMNLVDPDLATDMPTPQPQHAPPPHTLERRPSRTSLDPIPDRLPPPPTAHGHHAYSNSSSSYPGSVHTPPSAHARPSPHIPSTQPYLQPRSPSHPHSYYRTDLYPPPGSSPPAAQLPPIHNQSSSRDYYSRDRENHPVPPHQQEYAHQSHHHYQPSNHSSRASSPPPTPSSRGGPDRDRDHSSHSSHSNSASPYGSRTPQHSHAHVAPPPAPPPVPATFASIMNAYDNAPPYASSSQAQQASRPGTGSSASINGGESGHASVNGEDRRRNSVGSAGMSLGGGMDDVQ